LDQPFDPGKFFSLDIAIGDLLEYLTSVVWHDATPWKVIS
jgi:hypothetical protein